MADAGLTLHYLTTWKDVLAVARDDERFDKATLNAVQEFLEAPKEWSAAMAASRINPSAAGQGGRHVQRVKLITAADAFVINEDLRH